MDVDGFWGPVAGSMLAETGVNGSFNLWQSSDSGTHWTAVPLPQETVSWIGAVPGTHAGSWTPGSLPIRPQPIVLAIVAGQCNLPADVHAPELLSSEQWQEGNTQPKRWMFTAALEVE